MLIIESDAEPAPEESDAEAGAPEEVAGGNVPLPRSMPLPMGGPGALLPLGGVDAKAVHKQQACEQRIEARYVRDLVQQHHSGLRDLAQRHHSDLDKAERRYMLAKGRSDERAREQAMDEAWPPLVVAARKYWGYAAPEDELASMYDARFARHCEAQANWDTTGRLMRRGKLASEVVRRGDESLEGPEEYDKIVQQHKREKEEWEAEHQLHRCLEDDPRPYDEILARYATTRKVATELLRQDENATERNLIATLSMAVERTIENLKRELSRFPRFSFPYYRIMRSLAYAEEKLAELEKAANTTKKPKKATTKKTGR